MNKNKKITALVAVTLLTTSLVGCSSTLSKEEAHIQFDEFMEYTENLSVSLVDNTFDVMSATELNMGEFDIKDFEGDIEDFREDCEELKIKELREYGNVLADVMEDVCDDFDKYSKGKIDSDELQENVDKINLKNDAKAFSKVEKVAKKYKYDLEDALDNLEGVIEDAIVDATSSLVSSSLGGALESLANSLSEEKSNTTSNLDDIKVDVNDVSVFEEDSKEIKDNSSKGSSSIGYDDAFDAIMADAKKDDILDYKKGENQILDDIITAVDDFYNNGFDSVELDLYKKGRIDSDLMYEIESLTSEDKKKLEAKKKSMEDEFYSNGIKGIDKSNISIFYYDCDEFKVDEQVRVSLTYDTVGNDGKSMAIIGKPLCSFYIVKDNGEIKIVDDSIY